MKGDTKDYLEKIEVGSLIRQRQGLIKTLHSNRVWTFRLGSTVVRRVAPVRDIE